MIKKYFFTASASAVLLFSGCSIPFIEDETPTVSVDTATSLSQENPEQLFFDFAKASGAQAMEKINEAIPDRELLIKNKGNIALSGDFDLAGTPLGGGTGNFSMNVNVLSDYSNEENPLVSESIDVKVDAMGGMVHIDSQGEIRVVEQSVFGILNTLDFNIIGIGQKEKEIAQKFVGQWYGNTFEELNELMGEDSQNFDMKKMFTGGYKILSVFEIIDDIAANPENYIDFVSFIEEKDGYFFFEVTPKKETYEKFAKIFIAMIPVSGKELEKVEADIQKSIDELALQNIIIGYTPENPEYFKVRTVSGKLSAEKTAEGFMITGENPDNSDEKFTFVNKDGSFSLSLTSPEGTITPLTGTATEDSLTFEITDLDVENKKVVAQGSFSKTNDIWSGEITATEIPEGKLVFSDISYTPNSFNGKISALYNEKIAGNLVIAQTMSKPSSVSIEKPENVKAFKTLGEEIEKEVNAQYAVPNLEDTTIEKMDTNEDSSAENADADNADAENTNSGNATEENNPFETIPDPSNIPDVQVSTAATPSSNPVATPEPSAKADANTSSSSQELTPILDEMAVMMQNPPTEETQAKFMELANKVDALAKEKGISEDELKTLFQESVQKTSGQKLTPATEDIK